MLLFQTLAGPMQFITYDMLSAEALRTSKSRFAKISCAVKGPMIVIRARPDGMGEKFVNVLKEYLKYTCNEDQPWQDQQTDELPSWQLYEIIGDLGESDQTELYTKLSPWTRLR